MDNAIFSHSYPGIPFNSNESNVSFLLKSPIEFVKNKVGEIISWRNMLILVPIIWWLLLWWCSKYTMDIPWVWQVNASGNYSEVTSQCIKSYWDWDDFEKAIQNKLIEELWNNKKLSKFQKRYLIHEIREKRIDEKVKWICIDNITFLEIDYMPIPFSNLSIVIQIERKWDIQYFHILIKKWKSVKFAYKLPDRIIKRDDTLVSSN